MKRPCEHCGAEFDARNAAARFCRDRCRKASHRRGAMAPARPALTTVPTVIGDDENPETGPMARWTWRDLNALGHTEDVMGLLALVVARAIDAGPHTGASLTALTREWSRVWAVVGVAAKPATEDPLQRIRRQREERRARGDMT